MTGPKRAIYVGGRRRFPDCLTSIALHEVKNVAKQGLTSQLKDYLTYAQANGLDFILHTRTNTTFTKPLQVLISNGVIKKVIIPGF